MGAAEDWIKQQLADDWIKEQLSGADAAAPQRASAPPFAAPPAQLPQDITGLVKDQLANDGHAQQIAGSLEGAETELRDIGHFNQPAPPPQPAPIPEKSWYEGLAETAADSGAGVMNGVTLGYYDELKALLEGKDARDQLVARMQQAQQRSPKGYAIGNAAGSLLPTAALSAATGSPVAGAAISSGIAGAGNAPPGQRVAGAAKGTAAGLALGGVAKGVQQLGRIPTAAGTAIDDAVGAAKAPAQTQMPWAPPTPVNAPGVDRGLDWAGSLVKNTIPGARGLATADKVGNGGAVTDAIRTAARERVLGAGQALNTAGARITGAGNLGIEATAPTMAALQSRNTPEPSNQESGFGNLTGQAASVVMKADPTVLGPYAQQFREVEGDSRRIQELVSRLSATDQFFRTTILPKLQQTTTKGFQP